VTVAPESSACDMPMSARPARALGGGHFGLSGFVRFSVTRFSAFKASAS